MTKSHRSAAASSCAASSRLASTTESMSGASRRASPGGQRDGDGDRAAACRRSPRRRHRSARVRPGSTRVSENQRHVVGVADEHRGAGGRAQHPGGGDRRADQAVDQRGLAGAGRAADDGEQRGVEAAQPGQQVVVELADELGAGLARSFGARDVEREAGGGGGLAQRDESAASERAPR